jgi:hypothetical protein
LLGCHGHEVSGGVTNNFQAFLVTVSDDRQCRVRFNNMGGIHGAAIDNTGQGGFGQAGANISGDIVYRNSGVKRALAAVGQGNNRHELSFSQW